MVQTTQITTQTTTIRNNIVSVPQGSAIRTNPCFTSMAQVPTNPNNIQTNYSHSNYQITQPQIQPLTTVSNPKNINSSAFISEPIKSFEGLDHTFTPE